MTEEPRVWVAGRRRLTAGLVLTVTLVAFESLAVSTVMPKVQDDLGDLGLYGWVFSAFFLGSMIGAVVAGRLADERGTAPPYALGLVLFAAGIAVGGSAPTMPVLVGARFFQGIGAGAIPAVAYTTVGRAYPALVRPRVFAVFSTAWVVPGLVGPIAASTIAGALSWRWVFFAILPIVGIAAAMTLPALTRATDRHGAGPRDAGRVGRAVVLGAGAALVLGGLSADAPALVVVPVLVGLPVVAVAFTGLVPSGTARFAPGLPAAVALRGLLTYSYFATDAFLPLAVTDVRHRSTAVAAAALTASTLTWTAAAWVQQRRIHVDGPRRLVQVGLATVAVGTGGALWLLSSGAPIGLAIALWATAGFGIGLAYAPLSVTVLDRSAPGQEGAATAALQLTDVLGVALGTGAAGALVHLGDRRGWAPASSLVLADSMTLAVAVAGALLAARMPQRLGADTGGSQQVHSSGSRPAYPAAGSSAP